MEKLTTLRLEYSDIMVNSSSLVMTYRNLGCRGLDLYCCAMTYSYCVKSHGTDIQVNLNIEESQDSEK